MTSANDLLRRLPSVDNLLKNRRTVDLIAAYGRERVVTTLRDVLDTSRQTILAGDETTLAPDPLLDKAIELLVQQFLPSLRPVINATGIIIHTNLGRAPLSHASQKAMQEVAANYSNLEFNLESGTRGSRYLHAEEALKELTGAEAALVVNNNAAALVLMLSALARDRAVLISRGQLVEIGGGFRIPDIMAESGARLVEVGTTNRTRIADYGNAIGDDTALLLRVHASNFRIVGFTESATLEDLASLARNRGVMLVDDIGSGALLDTADFGLIHEPTAQESISGGADLVLFSGDKLLGGPQAGILVGRKDLVQTLKRHPLARALRADKLCYTALSATLDHYRRGEALQEIPVWQMLGAPVEAVRERAERWAKTIGGVVTDGESAVGGGSTPGTTLPTALLALTVESADELAALLRRANPPVVTRISEGRVVLDPRTVLPEQEASLLRILTEATA